MIKVYQDQTSNDVQPCGLFISLQHGYVAATPDGVVTDSQSKEVGLLEVKCYYSAVTQGQTAVRRAYTPQEAAASIKSCPLKIGEDFTWDQRKTLLSGTRCTKHHVKALV